MSDLFDSNNLKCLPLYGAPPDQRLYDQQRRVLEQRAAFVRRVRDTGGQGIDPVLRCHLGLEELPRTKK